MKVSDRTSSLLSELFNQSKSDILEARADHVFGSVFNFLDMIDDLDIPQEDKDALIKRFILSVKNRDAKKFMKIIRSLNV